jgi:hypothetical protein
MNINDSLDSKFDLCIIGAGPAGIIIALEFTSMNPSLKVLLIEYGGKGDKRKNRLDDSIKISNPTNHHAPYECTNKGLGGTSATWGGRCVMYDEIDFMDRPILENQCTWNKSLFHEIFDYLPRAAEYFECGNPVFNLNDIPEFRNTRIAEGFSEGVVTDSMLERWSMPTRFGRRYAKDLSHRKNLQILEGFEAREFSPPNQENDILFLKIRNLKSQEQFEISARKYVISAGAQETTRILLRNKQVFRNLDAPPPALGKYYQGHLSGKIASVRFKHNPRKTDFYFIKDADGTYLRRRFQFTTEYLNQQNLLNIAMWLDNPLYYNPRHRSGAMSFMYLAMLVPFLGKFLAPRAIARSITKGEKQHIGSHVWNIIKDFPFSVTKPATIFYERYCKKRKLPGVFLYNPDNHYALHFHAEQLPTEANFMELEPDGEGLTIHYSLSQADILSVIKLHEKLDQTLKELGCGELEYWYPKDQLEDAIRAMSRDGIHQSGTTRIADSSTRQSKCQDTFTSL